LASSTSNPSPVNLIEAGKGAGIFPSIEAGVEAMVKLDRVFELDAPNSRRYRDNFENYKKIWPLLKDYLRAWAAPPGFDENEVRSLRQP